MPKFSRTSPVLYRIRENGEWMFESLSDVMFFVCDPVYRYFELGSARAIQFTARKTPDPEAVRVDNVGWFSAWVDGVRVGFSATVTAWLEQCNRRGLYYFTCWVVTP